MEILRSTLRRNNSLLLGPPKGELRLQQDETEKENAPPSFNLNSNIHTGADMKAHIPFAVPQIRRVLVDGDSPIKVVVRIRGTRQLITKVSADTLTVDGDDTFKFDSVLGPEVTQEDVFNEVGIPLVQDSLNGFNASLVAYGQSGSGKSYSIWGPLSSMVSGDNEQGVVPRIFQSLFSGIQRKKEACGEKQINYQCRCSLLEIYNDQISDLLDPTQRDLQIKEDACSGNYVENLTDEYVTGVEDVNQILVKGLSNRKVGPTNMNSKSSRSHVIFTCIIESWSKGFSSNCFSSSRTSRITIVDLAGLADNGGSSKLNIQEEKHVRKSISNLGKVVNILSGIEDGRKDQETPYELSLLTHLLKDTFGGNSKATVLCTILDEASCRAGTLSTLRFGERAKCIQNHALINEITEDDVNCLSDQIRQLKEELFRTKTGAIPTTNPGCFGGKNARENLKILRMSLNRSLILPHIDVDSEEEMDVNEEDVRDLCSQISNLRSSTEESFKDFSDDEVSSCDLPCLNGSDDDPGLTDTDSNSQVDAPLVATSGIEGECSEKSVVAGNGDSDSTFFESGLICNDVAENDDSQLKQPVTSLPLIQNETQMQDPTLCSSPKLYNKRKKDMFSSMLLLSHQTSADLTVSDSVAGASRKDSTVRSSLQSTKLAPTESLAASLHKGMHIIEHSKQRMEQRKSFVGLSFDHLALKASQPAERHIPDEQALDAKQRDGDILLCSSCKGMMGADMDILSDKDARKQIVPSSEHEVLATTYEVNRDSGGGSSNALEKMVAELEARCKEQTKKIQSLTYQVSQYEQAGQVVKGVSVAIPQKESLPGDGESRESHTREEASEDGQVVELKSGSECLLEHIRNGGTDEVEEIEKERERWMESESRWISLAEELRADLESNRRVAERAEAEVRQERECRVELEDALRRAIHGHAMFVEHYAELQEAHNEVYEKHRRIMQGIAEVRRAAGKAGKRKGRAFASALAAELSTVRIERERERACLKEQNRRLRIQLRDTAEAVHAAGELLVRLREAEEKCAGVQQQNERLEEQLAAVKQQHQMELAALKHCLADSRLPNSALYRPHLDGDDDDMSWASAFSPAYH